MKLSILITGGCGFVGSNLAVYFKTQHPKTSIYALDNLKRKGSELNVSRLKEKGIIFIHGDIRNEEDFQDLPSVDILIECAAEPSVLSGINTTPNYVLNTNLFGTINCLNFCKKNNTKFIFLSTSRVYPISKLNNIAYKEDNNRFKILKNQTMEGVSVHGVDEKFDINGARSFYGSSKLASELLIQEFNEFYNLKTIINRCGVLAGPWQMGKVDQGVVSLWVSRHFWKKELNYIGYGGSGKQVRDILHISDLFTLLEKQINNFEIYNSNTFNVGGGQEVSVSLKELTELCKEITGNKITINRIKENRTADIPIYVSNNNKIKTISGWSPKKTLKDTIVDTFFWIKKHEQSLKNILS